MRLVLFALLVASSIAAPAFAQQCDRADETQTGLNICAAEDYRIADEKLNKAYGKVRNLLGADAEARKLLQVSQRAWIAFRDAECEFATIDTAGGSTRPLIHAQCLQAMTETRTAQLDAYLNCQEGDLSCPAPR